MGFSLDSLWNSAKDAGELQNGGIDLGTSITDIFGSNSFSSGLNSVLKLGQVGSAIDEAKAAKQKRENETKQLNEQHITKTSTVTTEKAKTFFEKNWKAVTGVVVVVIGLFVFAFRGGK